MQPDSPFYASCFNRLRQSPLFAGLEPEILRRMLAAFQLETWKHKAPAMDSRQTREKFYVIISGRLRVNRINPETGRELTVALLGPGDGFDIISLLDQREHKVATIALDDLETISTPIDNLRAWLGEHPELNRTFLPYLGEQLRFLEELATDVSLHDTLTRLVHLIIRHTHPGHQPELELIHDLSHEELAGMIGSVRAVVNRHLQNFKKEGIVETSRNHLVVKDLHALLQKIDEHPKLRL
jgi:CRP/FNR family transcriptional regulator